MEAEYRLWTQDAWARFCMKFIELDDMLLLLPGDFSRPSSRLRENPCTRDRYRSHVLAY